jgi:hypothetical protein
MNAVSPALVPSWRRTGASRWPRSRWTAGSPTKRIWRVTFGKRPALSVRAQPA